MSLKRLFRILLGIQFALGIGLAILAVALFRNEEQLSRSQLVHFQSFLLADELRQSSDDLTRLARTYVATGNEEYERQYWAVLDIRNGKIPRPVDYHRIYWDFVTETGQNPRPDGTAISLHELMTKEGFTDAEFEKLRLAQEHSDALVNTERIAMNAVKGLFDDGAGNFTVKKEPDRALAIKLMNDEAYHKNKAEIMRPIDEFYAMFEERTAGEVAKYEWRSMMLLQALGGLILVIMGMFGYSYVTVQRQIADRKKIEKEQKRLAAIIEATPDVVGYADAKDKHIIYLNKAARKMCGIDSNEDVTKLKICDVHPEWTNIMFTEEILPAAMSDGIWTGECAFLNIRDRHEIPVWMVLCSNKATNGEVETFFTISRDITERKRVEEELNQAHRAADNANRAKSAFLANMSHEIRTPMTAILGYAELMAEESTERTVQEHIEVIQRNGKHLLGLINDILDLSKIEAEKLQVEPICCSPVKLVDEVISLMQVRADAKHLKLEVDLAGPLPETVHTDPLRLRQILVNLVGNAIKFTAQGEVRLAVRMVPGKGTVPFSSDENRDSPQVAPFSSDENRDSPQVAPFSSDEKLGQSPDHRLCFDVIDTGVGMSDEEIGKLFQPFTQADGSIARKFGGTGLGLCISKRLCEALGGNIEVHSEPGKGSTFSVTIDPGPLDGIRMIQNAQEGRQDSVDGWGRHSCLPSAGKNACPTVQATPEKIALHGRILLAEDGEDNQRIICFLLKKAGAEVVAVENGQLALEQSSAAWEHGTPFDVILMDMEMPVMGGYEATRQLRERGYIGPIVALTAHSMAEDCQKCLDAGCDDYLSKPFEHRALLEMAARHINTVEPALGR